MNLFHVTIDTHARGIRERGVDPKRAVGKMEASWWVDEYRVLWALAHVSAKWEMAVDRLVIFEISSDDGNFIRWTKPGIFYTLETVRPDLIWGWENFVKPEV